jgi:DNA-binding cell septation regulator SpoVG
MNTGGPSITGTLTPRVLEVRRLVGTGNLKAFAVVAVGPWTVRGCRVVQQPGQRAYVSLPQEKTTDGRFFPILQTKDANLKDAIQAAVLEAWNAFEKGLR